MTGGRSTPDRPPVASNVVTYIIRRLIQAIPLLFIISLIVFLMANALPKH